jgi:hypothetical protein
MRSEEIIFLLGAGASYDAQIPISSKMINELEDLIKHDNEGKKYKNLYYCLKSGILYGFGITNKNDAINIELLVNTMDELIKSYEHPIYPFVGSWVPRLGELAGEEFNNIKKFKDFILVQLDRWMEIPHPELCDYYYGLIKFQKEFEFPLSVFSLNYDQCLEKQCGKYNIECNRGFNEYIWDYKNFDRHIDNNASLNLYKLHGSIDWENKNNKIEEKDGTIKKHAIIFGTSYKLQYLDPFLFLFYEFRRQTLERATKIINCIGYSFSDDHINGILGQALSKDNTKKIISIQPLSGVVTDNELIIKNEQNRIKDKLNLNNIENIIIINKGAKDFLERDISKEYYKQFLKNDDIPF